jgi:hypothetical protein
MLALSLLLIEEHSLSLLPKRMARVCASGSPSLTSAAAFQTQLRSLPTLGDSFMSGTTMLLSIRLCRSGGYHTVMVGADLERLVAAHDEARLAVLLVLQ